MTNQEILEKAISKAIATGWKPGNPLYDYRLLPDAKGVLFPAQFVIAGYDKANQQQLRIDIPNWETLCYSRDRGFAKALWPEPPERRLGTPIWKMKLQQMVIANDPIAYLGEHIDEPRL